MSSHLCPEAEKPTDSVIGLGKKPKNQKTTTSRLLKSDVSFVFTASSLITEPVVQTRALLLWLRCFFHSNLWGHSVLRAELCSRGEQIRENIQGATVIWSDTNTSFFSQPWKLRGFLQFSPLWWLCAPPLCVWCLPSAGHPRRCAPTPTRGPSSWQDRLSTPPLCCCSPCCPQVIMQGCVSPFPLTTKLFFFKYNLLIDNRVTSTLDSDAAPTAGQGLGLYKFMSAMPYIRPRRCTDSVVHLNTSHWIILKHSFQSRKTKLCWFNI